MAENFEKVIHGHDKDDFLEHTRQARLKRADDQKRQDAVLIIQSQVRMFLAKRKLRSIYIGRLEELFVDFDPESPIPTLEAIDVFQAAVPVIRSLNLTKELNQLEQLCRYVNWSINQPTIKHSYVAIGILKKEVVHSWIQHLKVLSVACLKAMTMLKPELIADSRLLSVFLNTVVSLTTPQGWKILKVDHYKNLETGMYNLSSSVFFNLIRNGDFFTNIHLVLTAGLALPLKFSIKKTNLHAIATLTNRSLIDSNEGPDPEKFLILYARHILSVPAYVYYVQSVAPEGLNDSIVPPLINCLYNETSLAEVMSEMNVSYVLSILANLVQLGEESTNLTSLFHPKFVVVISKLLDKCCQMNDQPKKNQWHKIFGWVSDRVPACFLNSSNAVKTQISALWSSPYLDAAFAPLHHYVNTDGKFSHAANTVGQRPSVKSMILKTFKRVVLSDGPKRGETAVSVCLKSQAILEVSTSCQLYNDLIKIFAMCKLDILTGICFTRTSEILFYLWIILGGYERELAVREWVEILLSKPSQYQESILVMFADCMIHLITMLDNQEMYRDQKVMSLSQIANIAGFVNQLCYRLISNPNQHKMKVSTWNSMKTLLMVLYRRDCRRKYCTVDHWVVESSKQTQLINDIEKGKKAAKRILLDMPHVLREDARVIFFRKWAQSEKTLNGNTLEEIANSLAGTSSSSSSSTLITIQRSRIVEDGYAQLANLSPKALKGTIRVRFQNALGLDEAGIDQDGVFKEFLEETINRVFDPSLNLFKTTSDHLLYPSPLSFLHENHLELFEFVGKMLAKAIYEGIVVDVHFATFFLSQILGYQQSALFSAIDELQSFDVVLYNSLNCIKHHEGDVQDMELIFSVDQDVLGEIRTTELIPGGRSVAVTNENKISYLYLMAHFHLYMQIKDQTAAFLKGFRAIIPNDWIRIFSPTELQRLISGEDIDIDLTDMRRSTQYYGGFHDNHRVIIWLWEILEQEFNEKERRLFLKFVTSCSKPPLLGFMNLDPPFSIRCVEVSDDEDTGDTIGSVLRGFLTISKKDPIGRLPTSSTCFNLLKLPNYSKKSTLRDKLRYAVTANVGFELS